MKSIILILLLTGCMYPPKKFTDKRLVIAAKETVTIPELNLSITNGGCGRAWTSENGQPAYEKVFCDISVKTKDSTYHFSRSGNELYIRNIKLQIDRMNPWGREEDSLPPGGCRILVTKMPDISR